MIKIKNWSSYQSYKDRKPPWIRLHKTLLDNYEFQIMSADARALLPMLWLIASEDEDPTSGLIKHNPNVISFRLRIPVKVVNNAIAEMECNGFLESIQPCNETVTETLRNRIQTVTPETETETETETEKNFPLSEKPKAVDSVFYLSRKKKKLTGKTLEAFNRFWKAFGYNKGKAEAADAFLAVYTDSNLEEIIRGAEQEAIERPGLIADRKTPKWAQGWLTARRWEEYTDTGTHEQKIILPKYEKPMEGVECTNIRH